MLAPLIKTLLKTALPTILKSAFTKKNITNPSTAAAVVVGSVALYQYNTTEEALMSGVLAVVSVICFFIRRYEGEK